VTAVRPDADALRTLAAHILRHGQEVSAAIESMTGARFVHGTLEFAGWDVAIGDATKVKGIAPSRPRPTRSTSGSSPSSPAGPRGRAPYPDGKPPPTIGFRRLTR
jgi:hypothetical protein